MIKSNKKTEKKHVNNEFVLYNNIVNGDLRPNLESFNNQNGLEDLKKRFFTIKLKFNGQVFEHIFDAIDYDFHGFKDGDKYEAELNDDVDPPTIIITPIQNPDENELINIDIPPPPDEKAEIFLDIIEHEYNRITTTITKILDHSNNENELKLYAIKNIQIAKKIAREAHTFEKKLMKEGSDLLDNSNYYIIYILKKYLIYSLINIQELYHPLIKGTIQNENELEDELFDFSYSKSMFAVKKITEDLNNLHLKNLYDQIGSNASIESKLVFFKDKLVQQKGIIDHKYRTGGIPVYLHDNMILYQKELGKILSEYYLQKLIQESNRFGIVEKYEDIIRTVTTLKVNCDSIETQALQTSDFFTKIELELNLLKELMNLSFLTPIQENVLSDLISFLIVLQSRRHLKLSENHMNDYLTDLLRAKGYYVADQSRSGRSGSVQTENYDSGELDISIRDIKNNGIIKTIIETFEISSCGDRTKTIKKHITKLISRYDTAGNEENYLIIFSKASNFTNLWLKYKSHVETIVFDNNTVLEEIENENFSKSDIKIGINPVFRERGKLKLYHLFVNMSASY